MYSSSTVPNEVENRGAIAPAWHTVIVLVLMLGVSLAGALTRNLPGVGTHGRTPGYLFVIAFEWITVAFIWYGVSCRGSGLRNLVGGRWARPVEAVRDLGIAIAFLIISLAVLNAIGYLLKAKPNQAIRNLLPQTNTELAVYLLLALTAGFCEETIFRGYLQRQFSALTRSAAGGIVLQGIAFGAGHGYQGWKYMVVIAVFGTMFGLLAYWRKSLRPGMIAHFVQDGIGGTVGRHFMR
jgi:uncharacterized protein